MFATPARHLIGALSGLVASVVLAGCTPHPPPPAATPPAPVTVARAAIKTVPVQLRAIGTVRVFASVSVRPRVSGELTEVHFKEGEFVEQGKKLFTIDPRPYRTALEQARALLDRNQALLRGAELVLARAQRATGGVISAEELDQLRTNVTSARAAVAGDQAAVRTAELQLSFTTIAAPIEGRTGNLLITPGNLVTANEVNPLVVINQISPISVSFAVPEQHLGAIEASRRQRQGILPVEALLRDGSPALKGELTFIDNAVDATTGTVQLKATFPNKDRRLWPGQFVDLVLTVSERPNSVIIPGGAVQDGQDGPYVFVVRGDNTAELRQIDVAFTTAVGEAVVARGLNGDETVVTDGHLRIAPGSKVSVKGAATAEKQS